MSDFAAGNHSTPSGNGPHAGAGRISAGQSPVPEAFHRLAALIAGSPHNLVARGERGRVLERHILECDALADMLTPAGRWMDLGTGAGLPGLVLAYRFPAVAWTLVDATRKKVDAVAQFAAALHIANVEALHGRAEALALDPAQRGRYDGVVARAVAPLAALAELARGFLSDGGLLVAVKGRAWDQDVREAAGALQRLHLEVLHSRSLQSPARPTWVVTMRAHGAPPAGYPRRDGLPQRDPLA